MYKVKGYADLQRDPHTNAIVNVNNLDHEKYVTRRAVKTEENQKVQSIEQEVANIRDDIDEIKFLLGELLNGSR